MFMRVANSYKTRSKVPKLFNLGFPVNTSKLRNIFFQARGTYLKEWENSRPRHHMIV